MTLIISMCSTTTESSREYSSYQPASGKKTGIVSVYTLYEHVLMVVLKTCKVYSQVVFMKTTL